MGAFHFQTADDVSPVRCIKRAPGMTTRGLSAENSMRITVGHGGGPARGQARELRHYYGGALPERIQLIIVRQSLHANGADPRHGSRGQHACVNISLRVSLVISRHTGICGSGERCTIHDEELGPQIEYRRRPATVTGTATLRRRNFLSDQAGTE